MESDMVEYRIGNRIVRVTKADAILLREDSAYFGTVCITIDGNTDIGTRIDPTTIKFKPPVDAGAAMFEASVQSLNPKQ